MIKLLRGLEAAFGMLCVVFIAVALIAVVADLFLDGKPRGASDGSFQTLKIFLLTCMVIEAVFVCVLSDKWKQTNNPLELAIRMRKWPLIVRPFLGCWWTAHFLLGLAIALAVETVLAASGFSHGIAIQILSFFIVSFTLAYGFNLYLMLALAAFGCSEKFLRIAWKRRAMIDLALATAAALLAVKTGPAR